MEIIKVLLADDHLITREGVRRLLTDEPNFKVIGEASDGEEAVKRVSELHPDVVIMDVAMPKLNGIEATRQIKLNNPEIAVLILTAYDDDEYVFGLLEAGASGYLLKTASGDSLIRAINAVYKNEPMLDPIIARKVLDRFRFPSKVQPTPKVAEPLSDREMEILKLAAEGMGNKDIAEKLDISRRTVEGALRTIFNKLGVSSRVEAITYALKKGWFTLEELS
jgi:two-component system, NarL family, response regulator LiaR